MSVQVDDVDSVASSVCEYLKSNSSIASWAIADFDEDLSQHQLDSLQLIQLVIWIEGVIGKPVEIEALFAEPILSISSIARYIQSQKAR